MAPLALCVGRRVHEDASTVEARTALPTLGFSCRSAAEHSNEVWFASSHCLENTV